MAQLRSEDIQAIWLLQSRLSFARLGFWLILAGYNPKTRSFESRAYLVYVILFFSVWTFATLTLLASAGRSVLDLLPFEGPVLSAVWLGLFGFSVYFLIQLNQSARRSPFVFSEVDTYQLCLTPLDRRPVALAWFVKDWIRTAIFIWAGAVVLGYALLEAEALRELTAADLPRYFLAGLRMLVIVIPLHLGLHSLAWSLGASRLHNRRRLLWLRWVVPLASVVWMGGWLLMGTINGNIIPNWLRPLSIPIQAGLGAAAISPGLGLAGLWMLIGLTCLWRSSNEMSLIQASEETKGEDVLKTAFWMGDSELALELKQRRRLGAGQRPSRFLLGHGWLVLVSRDLVLALRSWSLNQLAGWMMIFGVSLGMLLSPDWEGRAFMTLLWILAIGQRASLSIKKDLQHWWLMNQLPYRMDLMVMIKMIIPLVAVGILSVLALVVAQMLGAVLPAYIWIVFIPTLGGVALSAAIDLLRQCRTSRLLAGISPDLTFITVAIGVLVAGICLGSAWLLVDRLVLPAFVWIPLTSLLCLGLDFGLFNIVQRLFQRVRSPLKL
jgi:hypothetical protein